MRKPAWLAEVIVQSIAVTVSILLALWVDQWKQRRAERTLAVESMRNFVEEISKNQSRIDDILMYHEGLQSHLQHVDSTHSIRTQTDFRNEVGLDGLRPPSLGQSAWQTAVATGVLAHLDFRTVSLLSFTYNLQDRLRDDGRTGFQSVMQASDFRPGGADLAVHSAENYLAEVLGAERDLRASYVEAEQILNQKLRQMDQSVAVDTAASGLHQQGAPAR